jgi:hypothetical protein
MAGHWPAALDRAEALRPTLPAGSWVDVRHADLARDPLAAVQAIYAGLDLEFGAETRAAVTRFLAQEATGPRHRHEHSPAGFGLAGDAIRERFADYVARYAL